MLGVLGGMGPLATVDFMAKLVASTPAVHDADHIPVLLRSVPQIPGRSEAIFGQGPSPFDNLCAQAKSLKREGATLGVMPCNTAHHWFGELSARSDLEFLHIADAVISALDAESNTQGQVGLLATPGTLHSGFYQRRLEAAGYHYLVPDDALLENLYANIALVKAGQPDRARPALERSVNHLLEMGATRVILACTELPAVLSNMDETIDPTRALAKLCVKRFSRECPESSANPEAHQQTAKEQVNTGLVGA